MNVLFVGIGATAPFYYRCMLPARALGMDYVGVVGEPAVYRTGLVGGQSRMPDMHEYDIVILQQPNGRYWLETIRDLQAAGVTVIYEIDDYLHGVHHVADHAFRGDFTKDALPGYEMCMKACDGMIVSTEVLRSAYRPFMKRKPVTVCLNGLDLARYDLTKPPADGTVTIGWAGATGHDGAVVPWLQQVAMVMAERPHTRFMSVGVPYANGFLNAFGADRCVSVPFAAIENYPCAMVGMDIALAPAGKGLWARAKSDLRWLEAGALGIPAVVDPVVYRRVLPGVNGWPVKSPEEAGAAVLRLVDDEKLRTRMGDAARAYVRHHCGIDVVASQWLDAIDEIVSRRKLRTV